MFCPAVAFDLKNTSPTTHVPGSEVPVFIVAVDAAPVISCLPVKTFVEEREAPPDPDPSWQRFVPL